VTVSTASARQEELYAEIAATYGPALGRLARAHEADTETCRDLLQEIHIALWRSLRLFDGRCSLRTWVYRVAHNVAASHAMRDRRARCTSPVALEELDFVSTGMDAEAAADRRRALDRLMDLIQQLKPLDRQVILLYLEGLDAAAIGEVAGASPGNVATKIHRIKSLLARQFHEGGRYGEPTSLGRS
jgi:RNA polymerase sigma-70 factor (ECF subfamily)